MLQLVLVIVSMTQYVENFNLQIPHDGICRHSRSQMFLKIGALKSFAKFIGKHLCQSFFFNKVAGLRPATLLKKGLWDRCFPVNFAKILRTPFFQNIFGGCFCATLSNMNNSKAFLVGFYYWFQNSCYAQQFPFKVNPFNSNYLSD